MNPLIWVDLDPRDFLFWAATIALTVTVVLLAVNAHREERARDRQHEEAQQTSSDSPASSTGIQPASTAR
jgi:hypothetical protein